MIEILTKDRPAAWSTESRTVVLQLEYDHGMKYRAEGTNETLLERRFKINRPASFRRFWRSRDGTSVLRAQIVAWQSVPTNRSDSATPLTASQHRTPGSISRQVATSCVMLLLLHMEEYAKDLHRTRY